MRRQVPAMGRRRAGRTGRETGIIFDDDMFEAIRQRAQREGTTFAEQVRTFCQWGLDATEEEARKAEHHILMCKPIPNKNLSDEDLKTETIKVHARHGLIVAVRFYRHQRPAGLKEAIDLIRDKWGCSR